MKCYFKSDGVLVIQSQNGVEAFALKKWQGRKGRAGKVEFDFEGFDLEETWRKFMDEHMKPMSEDFLAWKAERGEKLLRFDSKEIPEFGSGSR